MQVWFTVKRTHDDPTTHFLWSLLCPHLSPASWTFYLHILSRQQAPRMPAFCHTTPAVPSARPPKMPPSPPASACPSVAGCHHPSDPSCPPRHDHSGFAPPALSSWAPYPRLSHPAFSPVAPTMPRGSLVPKAPLIWVWPGSCPVPSLSSNHRRHLDVLWSLLCPHLAPCHPGLSSKCLLREPLTAVGGAGVLSTAHCPNLQICLHSIRAGLSPGRFTEVR